jgi:isoquinoline 1-oxidoreductase beta subunit
MEPLNCTVAFDGQKADLWMGTQMPGFDALAAEDAGRRAHGDQGEHAGGRRRLRPACHPHQRLRGGSLPGRQGARRRGLDAPVRTLWSREDDIKGGYYRPLHVHRAEIGFDAQGNILAWDHVIVGQSILKGSPFEAFMVKDGIDATMVEA